MDKRFKPPTTMEALKVRLVLAKDLRPIPSCRYRWYSQAPLSATADYRGHAKWYGVSPRTLQDIEHEESNPTLATTESFCDLWRWW